MALMKFKVHHVAILGVIFLFGCGNYDGGHEVSAITCDGLSDSFYELRSAGRDVVPELGNEILVTLRSDFEFTEVTIFPGDGDRALFMVSLNGEDPVEGSLQNLRYSRLVSGVGSIESASFVQDPRIFHPACFDVRIKNGSNIRTFTIYGVSGAELPSGLSEILAAGMDARSSLTEEASTEGN
jgi:hypothetical protein